MEQKMRTFEAMPRDIKTRILSFFSSKELGRIASTCKSVNQIWKNRIERLINKADISLEALAEFEKRCNLYTYQGAYYLVIDSYDFNNKNTKEKTILNQPLIKNLNQFGDYKLYFYSPNGIQFTEMHRTRFGGNDKEHSIAFKMHETEDKSCKMMVDPSQAILLKPNATVPYGKKPQKEDTLATYHITDPNEKKMILLQLLANESQLKPLQYVKMPTYFFKIKGSNQYILVKSQVKDCNFTISIGNGNNWQNIDVVKVQCYRDGGTIFIHLNENNGYKTIYYCPIPIDPQYASWQDGAQAYIKLSNEDKVFLEKLEHRTFNFISIGITLDLPNPRPTPMDKHSNELLENNFQI